MIPKGQQSTYNRGQSLQLFAVSPKAGAGSMFPILSPKVGTEQPSKPRYRTRGRQTGREVSKEKGSSGGSYSENYDKVPDGSPPDDVSESSDRGADMKDP